MTNISASIQESSTQHIDWKYTVVKKKLLGIVKWFKAFEGILRRGTEATVHIGYLNLLCKTLSSQSIVQWQLLLKEFYPTFKHVVARCQ